MKTINQFSADELQSARAAVSRDWEELQRGIRSEDHYASHVTEETKDQRLQAGLVFAAEIATGKHDGCFTIWQRIYLKLTGECVAFLP